MTPRDPIMEEWHRIGADNAKAIADFDAQHAETRKAIDAFCEVASTLKAQLGARLLGMPEHETGE